jgi:hypothetical protein
MITQVLLPFIFLTCLPPSPSLPLHPLYHCQKHYMMGKIMKAIPYKIPIILLAWVDTTCRSLLQIWSIKVFHQLMHNRKFKNNFKFTLKLTLKICYMFRCQHHLQGAHYVSLLKLQLLKSFKIHRCG